MNMRAAPETTRTPVIPTNRFPCLVPELPSKAPPASRSFSVLPFHPVSIVIPAFRAAPFIEAALDSVERQNYFNGNDRFEVIIGVDGCEETRARLAAIKSKYRNLRVCWFPDNVGCYVVRNTLLHREVKHERVILFDADDLMRPDCVLEIMRAWGNNESVRFLGKRFFDDPCARVETRGYALSTTGVMLLNGIFAITRTAFCEYGGFQPWKCAADSEFLRRGEKHGLKTAMLKNTLVDVRKHRASLTLATDTGMTSRLRDEYREAMRVSDWPKYVEPVMGEYVAV